MSDFPAKSHKHAKVAIDEQSRMAGSSLQFLLENRDKIPITRGNTLSFLICGHNGFSQISKDLLEAEATADIICWGFDPGMELVRDPAKDKWPRGQTYGQLLEEITTREKNPVTVRLLIWYDQAPSFGADNMPGYTDNVSWNPRVSSPYAQKERQDYCIAWWKKYLPGEKNDNHRLRVALRSVSAKDVENLMKTSTPHVKGTQGNKPEVEDAPVYTESVGFERAGTHHQKPILIDYDLDDGRKAIGYVMGLNSVTDYWDTTDHVVDDKLRELWASGSLGDESGHQKDAEGKASSAVYLHSKPYQDYACRIQGPALAQLKYNFENAWYAAFDQPIAYQTPPPPPAKIKKVAGNPAHLVQIVRTQAHEQDKSIKEIYFQASSNAYQYIYIENQYFFYPEFARVLKETRETFCEDWKKKSGKPITEAPKLHLFVVIPHPERDQMIPRTFDMLTELGESSAMPEQRSYSDKGRLGQVYPDSKPGAHGGQVLDRPSLDDLDQTRGLDVSIARLRTSNGLDSKGKVAYREIYIHSKLMIIDDVFITIGSANLNQRSMSVDSEINIAATGKLYANDLRERIFEMHTGGSLPCNVNPDDWALTFRQWNAVMSQNAQARKSGKPMSGFILQFEDHRSTRILLGQVDVPSSNDTALA